MQLYSLFFPILTSRIVYLSSSNSGLGALLKAAPRAYGWCHTRWSCATLAATLQAKHGIAVSAEPVRRWLQEIGWVWKRAKLVAKDDDPQRIARLAQIRFQHERLRAHEVMVFADELDIHLLPKVGAAWMRQGTQDEIMTPGTNEKHYLAGALHLPTGKMLYCLGPRKNNGLFRALLTLLDTAYPASAVTRIYVVVDNYCCIQPKPSNSGSPVIHVLSCSGYQRTVRVPTPLSGCLAMCTTSAPGITDGNASAIWCRMSSGIWQRMAPGRTGSPSSMTRLRSPRRSST